MNKESIDFSIPQRLSVSGFWVQAILNIWKFIKAIFIILIYSVVKNFEMLLRKESWLFMGGILLVILLFSYFYHKNFKYWINQEDGEIILEKGILNKSKTVLKFENIQQVNIKQNILQQALDIYAMEIESAGSSGKEMVIYALDEDVALQLKAQINQQALGYSQIIREEKVHTTLEEEEVKEENLLFHIPAKNIFLISLFTNYGQGILLFLAFIFSIFEKISDLISYDEFVEHSQSLASSITLLSLSVLVTLLFIMLIPIIINLFKYLIKYYSFSMRRENNGNIIMKYGLFEVNELLLNREKVQKIKVSDNLILKKLKLSIISLHQIVTDTKSGSSIIIIPGANQENKEALWKILFKKANQLPVKSYKPVINLLLIRLSWIFILAIIVTYILYLNQAAATSYYLLLGLSLPVFISQYIYYKNYHFYIREDILIKNSGIWDQTQTFIPLDKIQSVEVTQTLFQKRSHTANLNLSTASGIVVFSYFNLKDLQLLSNEILLEIEIHDSIPVK